MWILHISNLYRLYKLFPACLLGIYFYFKIRGKIGLFVAPKLNLDTFVIGLMCWIISNHVLNLPTDTAYISLLFKVKFKTK